LHCEEGCNAVVAKARWNSEGSVPLEIGRPKAHMPPAMIMGVTDEKKRACVMLVFSMPSTQEAKCIASAAPDSSIRRPLCCVCFLSSAATHPLNKCAEEALARLCTIAQCPWPSCRACGRANYIAKAAPNSSISKPLCFNSAAAHHIVTCMKIAARRHERKLMRILVQAQAAIPDHSAVHCIRTCSQAR